jgi:hypothetical protein
MSAAIGSNSGSSDTRRRHPYSNKKAAETSSLYTYLVDFPLAAGAVLLGT